MILVDVIKTLPTWQLEDNILTSWIVWLLLEKDCKERYKLAFSKVRKEILEWVCF